MTEGADGRARSVPIERGCHQCPGPQEISLKTGRTWSSRRVASHQRHRMVLATNLLSLLDIMPDLRHNVDPSHCNQWILWVWWGRIIRRAPPLAYSLSLVVQSGACGGQSSCSCSSVCRPSSLVLHLWKIPNHDLKHGTATAAQRCSCWFRCSTGVTSCVTFHQDLFWPMKE